MAQTLDQMLEPGERVLWRMPRVLLPRNTLWFLGLLPLVFVLQLSVYGFDPGRILLTFKVLLLLFGIFGVVASLEDWSARTLVTDRRLLHKVLWRAPLVTAIPLAEIAGVEVTDSGALRVERSSGADFTFDDPRRAQDLAVALAEAAGLQRPVVYGRLVGLEWFAMIGGMMTLVVPVVWIAEPLAEFLRGVDSVSAVLAALGLGLVGVLAIFAGVTIGMTLVKWGALAVLRPFVPAETARNWLRRHMESEARLLLHDRITQKWTRRWVALLWGEAIDNPKEGANAHG